MVFVSWPSSENKGFYLLSVGKTLFPESGQPPYFKWFFGW